MKRVKKFLVVDDDPAARFLAGDAIEEANLAEAIIYCQNGEEALEYIKRNCLPTEQDSDSSCPELILLDINMPVMNGYEFLEELASMEDLKHTDTSVIVLSSSSYLNEESRIKRFSIVGYIEKPVMSEKLREIVTSNYNPLIE